LRQEQHLLPTRSEGKAIVDHWLLGSGTKEDPHTDDDWWATT
jgi:hypothetical protein